MSKKPEPLFRVSYIVQGAESLDTALRSANGLTIYPPLVEPYHETPTPITEKPKPPKLPKQATRHLGEKTLKDIFIEYLNINDSLPSKELSKIARDNGFSPGNVSKAATRAGATFNPTTQSWSLNK